MAYTHITPGWEIEMSAHYYPDKKADRVAELIQLPREELTTMEEASVAQEKAIFSKFSEIEAEWRKQAAETIAIRKAREYLRALPGGAHVQPVEGQSIRLERIEQHGL